MHVCMCVCIHVQTYAQPTPVQQHNANNNHKLNAVSLFFFFVVAPFLCCSLSVFVPLLVTALCCCCCCRQSNWRVWKFLLYLFYSICCCTHWTFEVFFSFLYLRVVNYLTCFLHPMERFTRTKTSGVVASPFVLCKFLWGFFYLTAWPYIFCFFRGSLL